MRVALSYPFSVLLSYLVISTSMQVTAVSHSTIQHVNTLVSDVLKKDQVIATVYVSLHEPMGLHLTLTNSLTIWALRSKTWHLSQTDS